MQELFYNQHPPTYSLPIIPTAWFRIACLVSRPFYKNSISCSFYLHLTIKLFWSIIQLLWNLILQEFVLEERKKNKLTFEYFHCVKDKENKSKRQWQCGAMLQVRREAGEGESRFGQFLYNQKQPTEHPVPYDAHKNLRKNIDTFLIYIRTYAWILWIKKVYFVVIHFEQVHNNSHKTPRVT